MTYESEFSRFSIFSHLLTSFVRSPHAVNILYLENHVVFAQQVTRQFLSAHRVTVVPGLSGARSALATGTLRYFRLDCFASQSYFVAQSKNLDMAL